MMISLVWLSGLWHAWGAVAMCGSSVVSWRPYLTEMGQKGLSRALHRIAGCGEGRCFHSLSLRALDAVFWPPDSRLRKVPQQTL